MPWVRFVTEYLNALDTIAAEVQERTSQPVYPLSVIETLNPYRYRDLGLRGMSASSLIN